jgi:hypothetical protein
VDLGTVTIGGDLGCFMAGDNNDQTPGIGSLTVQSLGALGSSTQDGGNLESFVQGALKKLVVKSDIRGASLVGSREIGTITIGNSFLGGSIAAGADLGQIDVRGDVVGTAAAPVVISAVGKRVAPSKGIDTAIKTLSVKGGVEFLRVLAGYNATGDGLNADAAIGSIKIGGHFRSSTVLAGVFAGDDGLEGTLDDAKLSGFGVRDNTTVATLVSQIASITIKGQALGTSAPGDGFGIVAEQINAAKIGGSSLPFVKGPHTIADFIGLVATDDFSIGEARN